MTACSQNAPGDGFKSCKALQIPTKIASAPFSIFVSRSQLCEITFYTEDLHTTAGNAYCDDLMQACTLDGHSPTGERTALSWRRMSRMQNSAKPLLQA